MRCLNERPVGRGRFSWPWRMIFWASSFMKLEESTQNTCRTLTKQLTVKNIFIYEHLYKLGTQLPLRFVSGLPNGLKIISPPPPKVTFSSMITVPTAR